MYPVELEIKDTAESNTSASYLDLLLSIGRDGQLHTSIYDKRDDFNFHITNFPFLSSNFPTSPAYGVFISQLIRYARACSSYGCFILKARRLSNKLLDQTGIRQGTLEIVIEEVLWSILGSYQTIWSFPLTNVKWHSVTWPCTMTNPYLSDFVPNSTFYRILSGFHRTVCDGCCMPTWDAYSSGHLVLPLLRLFFCFFFCSTCWDQRHPISVRHSTSLWHYYRTLHYWTWRFTKYWFP